MPERIVLSTFPDEESAKEIAKYVVKEKLAACVNIAKVKSYYWWNGALTESEEYLAILKTNEEKVEEMKRTVENRHPYEVPEVIEIPITAINNKYLLWINNSLGTS